MPESVAMMRHVADVQALRWAISGGEEYEREGWHLMVGEEGELLGLGAGWIVITGCG